MFLHTQISCAIFWSPIGADMADQELRKMKRIELLEMMVSQAEAVKSLQEELQKEKERTVSLEEEIKEKDRTISHLKEKEEQKDEEMEGLKRSLAVIYGRQKKDLEEKDKMIARLQEVAGAYRGKLIAARKELEAVKANPIVPDTDLVNREKVIRVFEEVKKAADNYIGALRQDEKGSDADES